MPAEWEPHAATWLSWPSDPVTFPDRLPAARDAYRDMLRALTPHERVNLLVPSDEAYHRVQAWLAEERIKNVHVWDIPPSDVWFRDYGPIFVKRAASDARGDHAEIAMTNWQFNAWGGKYEELLPDNAIPRRLQRELGMPMFDARIVLEGGSIDVNGQGTLLTTEQCLLNENRNPGLTREDIEAYLEAFLAIKNVLWLGDGLQNDDTDGHIDDLTRFVGPGTVVTTVEDDPESPNYEALQENRRRLRHMTTQDGKPLQVIEIPTPGRQEDDDGEIMAASYANFYLANQVILVPQFNHPNDKKALQTLQKCFPDRQAVPIDTSDLIHGGGTLHCITQQQPLPSRDAPPARP